MLKAKAGTRSREQRKAMRPRTRRTTLTLPHTVLKDIERLARARRQTVSSAAACLLEQALRAQPPEPGDANRVVDLLRRSFAGLTEHERLLVDGIIIEEPAAHKND